MTHSGFEVVYAVTAYVDGILAGVADFEGSPHIFVMDDLRESEPDPSYRVSLVPEASLPFLSGQRPRDIWKPPEEIVNLVSASVKVGSDRAIRAIGTFLPADEHASGPDLKVRWVRLDAGGGG